MVKGETVMSIRQTWQRFRTSRWRLELEPLEDRVLMSITVTGLPNWTDAGPGPMLGSNGLVGLSAQNFPKAGAIQEVLQNPADNGTLYAATVNGGVWVTHDYLSNPLNPHWKPLTDLYPSLSIRSLALDPTDTSGQTLYAGTGRVSHGFGWGGPAGRAAENDGRRQDLAAAGGEPVR
jgi:hypothetical protein